MTKNRHQPERGRYEESSKNEVCAGQLSETVLRRGTLIDDGGMAVGFFVVLKITGKKEEEKAKRRKKKIKK